MKKFLLVIILISAALIIWMFGKKHAEIRFINASGVPIDSLVVYVCNYKWVATSINPGQKIRKRVPMDSVDFVHDFVIVPTVRYRDTIISGAYIYTDLGGAIKSTDLVFSKDLVLKFENTRW